MLDLDQLLEAEFERARKALQSLATSAGGSPHCKSLGADVDAVLIAKNISKLSPFVSTQVENAVIQAPYGGSAGAWPWMGTTGPRFP